MYLEWVRSFVCRVFQDLPWWSSWAQIVGTIVIPVGLGLAIRQIRLQTDANLVQTLATVISWVQADSVRESRRLLLDLEKNLRISTWPAHRWQPKWKDAADRVSSTFNSAALVAQRDARLQKVWIRPTRRAILLSRHVVQPRIEERRKEEGRI